MMKKRALIVVVAGVLGLLMTALAPLGGAAAQPQPTLTITPSSGPCDGTVEAEASGFRAGEEVPLDVGRPQSDGVIGRLVTATADSNGRFAVRLVLGDAGCDAAALQDQLGPPGSARQIEIYAGFRQDVLFVAARARYGYTTISRSTGAPQALPNTGYGEASHSAWRTGLWAAVLLATGLAALGLSIIAARRRHRG
jgi:hypothetical protein